MEIKGFAVFAEQNFFTAPQLIFRKVRGKGIYILRPTLNLERVAKLALAVACAQGISMTAYAQAGTGISIPASAVDKAGQEGLRRQEERQRELQQQLEIRSDVLTSQEKPPSNTELPIETRCFAVHEIQLTGTDAGRFVWLQESILPFIGRCVGVTGLRRIAEALDATLIETGFATTRVSLPEQNLKTGKILIHVHAGRVSDIRMASKSQNPNEKNTSPDSAWGTWWNAFPLSAGAILNIRALEQGVEQMQRLPSQSVSTRIEPGAEPDTSVVVIERRSGTLSERLRGGVTLDNSGSKSLGRAQLSSHLGLDNLETGVTYRQLPATNHKAKLHFLKLEIGGASR